MNHVKSEKQSNGNMIRGFQLIQQLQKMNSQVFPMILKRFWDEKLLHWWSIWKN